MDNSKEKLIVALTDKELEDHFINTKKYKALEIASSLAELCNRGKFDEFKLLHVLKVIKKKLIDEGPSTPNYYSQNAIFDVMLVIIILQYVIFQCVIS